MIVKWISKNPILKSFLALNYFFKYSVAKLFRKHLEKLHMWCQQHSAKTTKSEPLLFIFGKLLYNETILPPSVFFIFILLQQLDLLNLPTKVNWLFFIGILFFLLTLSNHYFYFSSTLNINLGSFIPINFILGILGCNQKSKLLLFCFSCCYYLPLPHTQIQDLLVIIISAIICYLTF